MGGWENIGTHRTMTCPGCRKPMRVSKPPDFAGFYVVGCPSFQGTCGYKATREKLDIDTEVDLAPKVVVKPQEQPQKRTRAESNPDEIPEQLAKRLDDISTSLKAIVILLGREE